MTCEFLPISSFSEQALVFIEQMASVVLDVGKSALFAQQSPFGVLKLGLERISLLPECVIVSDQAFDIRQRSIELESERFEFVLVHAQLVPAGFERGRVAEPVVGVFYIEGVHGHALLILFTYTVIEALPAGEGVATSCRIFDWFSVGRTPEEGKSLYQFLYHSVRFAVDQWVSQSRPTSINIGVGYSAPHSKTQK